MSSWKVLLTDGLEENGQAILRQGAEVSDQKGISADDLLKVAADFDALIVRGRTKVTAAVLDAAPKMKVVGRSGVGVDNIDLEAAKSRGVTVVNAPIATSISVAELTLALMLSVVREVPRADASMKAGGWIKKELEGVELNGKTLGIIGFGRIGALVASRAAAFGMNILGYDPLVPPAEIESRGGTPVSLDDLLKRSDMITLHLPLTPQSKHLLDESAFAKMKKGVYVICAARGGIIDESALLAALNSGHVAGAGLDVFAVEPPADSSLTSHPKVVATPHIGGQTVEAQGRAAEDIATEVIAALSGKPLRWKVA